jgi:hypothetical protein
MVFVLTRRAKSLVFPHFHCYTLCVRPATRTRRFDPSRLVMARAQISQFLFMWQLQASSVKKSMRCTKPEVLLQRWGSYIWHRLQIRKRVMFVCLFNHSTFTLSRVWQCPIILSRQRSSDYTQTRFHRGTLGSHNFAKYKLCSVVSSYRNRYIVVSSWPDGSRGMIGAAMVRSTPMGS